MADLHLDNDVSLRLVPLLQAAGYDVTTARGLNLRRVGDDAQLLAAVRARRVLITHNRREFAMLHDAWHTWPAAFGFALPAHSGPAR